MIRRMFFGVIAAGAISVALAPAAGADVAADNPGLPGEIGVPPGCQVAAYAQFEPGLVPQLIEAAGTPGSFYSQYTPGHTR